MTKLGLARLCAMIDFTIDNEPTPDTAAGVCIEDRIKTRASPTHGLRKRGDVRVVIDRNGKACDFAQPIAQREIVPAFHVVGTANAAGFPIDGTPITDTHGLPGEMGLKTNYPDLYLLTDNGGTIGGLHGDMLPVDNFTIHGASDKP